ncbi:serine/threonine-protein kinase [Oryzobacter sp. R7]|uniref:serine/threonine-protein kinase n=1 Tax=Oryzobacter faecalis TaxID=3388656 RepID=UPI00398D452E
MTAAHEPEAPGQPEPVRLGPYRLLERLGEGGMGVVHLGLDPHGRAVAIKVLRSHVADDPDARARLSREVTTLGRIRSSRVAPVIDADVDGATPYIVTRYVPGPSLDEHVGSRGPLPPGELHRVASGIAEALDVIHSAGVVHRDVKPGNVLLVDGEPVLIDFGIAHVADDIRLTMTGLVMGTPGYLAPEVVGGEDVTPATDWWGWAATTAFAATGAPPFGRGAMNAVLARVAAGEPDLEAVDPRIEPLLYAALSPHPGDRPHHGEVVAALEQYAHGAPVTEAIEVRRVRPATAPLRTAPTSALPVAAAGAGAGPAGAAASAAPPSSAPPVPVAPGAPQQAPPLSVELPPPMVSTGRAAGPPGWERAVPAAQARGLTPQPAAGPPPATATAIGPVAPRVAPSPYAQPGPPVPPTPGSQQGDAEDVVHGGWGDPRIGRASRSGTLLALLALFAGLTARLPAAAVLALFAGVVVARTADRSVTSLVLRRHSRGGARGSDVAVAVASSPWHLVVGTVGAAVSLALPLVVGVCAMFAGAVAVAALTGGDVRPDGVLPLAGAGVFAALTAWWGPGGASLRRGSRSLVRGFTPSATAAQVAAGALLVGAALFLVSASVAGEPDWWPRTTAPTWIDEVARIP